MNIDEKLQIIEKVLEAEPNTLTENTPLDSLQNWNSLTILNLQIELTVIRPDLSFDNLHECKTAGEICGMI